MNAAAETERSLSYSPVAMAVAAFLMLALIPLANPGDASVTVNAEFPVVDGDDDSEERSRGRISTSSRDLNLGEERGQQAVGVRFRNVEIPNGAEITNAWIQFTPASTTAGQANFEVAFEDSDNALPLTKNTYDLSGRTVLPNSVRWTPTSWTADSASIAARTPNLTDALTTIVTKPGWSEGNSVVVIITGTGTRAAHSANVGSDVAPRLHVEYVTESPANQPPTVDAGPDQTAQTNTTVNLNGTATDDGLPNPPATLTTTWTLLTGPDTPTITNPNTPTTTATFPTPGTYTLRLTATDSQLTTTSDTTITVTNGSGTARMIEVQVESSGADLEENSVTGSVSDTSSDLELVDAGDDQLVGLHFTGVAIPEDSVILDAYLQFTADETQSDLTNLVIQAVAEDNAAPFQDVRYGVSARSRTVQSASWSPPPWTVVGEAGPDQQTSSIAAVIQAIVERPGWVEGNAIGIVITGSGHRTADSWDGDPNTAPVLHIEYGEAANDRPTLAISSPSSGETVPDGTTFTFSATASDTEDGDLSATIEWSSDSSGPIGTGDLFDAALSPGYHLVTATVTDSGGRSSSDSVQVAVTSSSSRTLIGAGDIARCSLPYDEATADILDDHAGATVFTAGDAAYDNGTAQEFAECYDPSWGRHKAFTRPSVGNHEYQVPDAADYFAYFGDSAGTPGEGWYSYDVGPWHVVVLNSMCDLIECGPGSAQHEWLVDDLARSAANSCIAAYWHHPRFSSGVHGADTAIQPLWDTLNDYGTDVVINGHDHNYERFVPMDSAGAPDPNGIRLFVVGTGGTTLRDFVSPALPTTAVRDATSHGVLKLDLRAGAYDWTFLPIAGDTFTDSGTAQCVSPADELPTVDITSPDPDSTFNAFEPVELTASAVDPEDGDLSSTVVWSSDLDGALGVGTTINTTNLSLGTHEIAARVVDSAGRDGLATITVTIVSASGNFPPDVSAGDDVSSVFGEPVILVGIASDDGLPDPPGSLTYLWETISSEGVATFEDATSLSTGVTFSEPGTYAFRLGVSDGEFTIHDTVVVDVVDVIDPSITQSIDVRVARSPADAEESPTGKIDLSSSDLELTHAPEDQTVGIVFENVDLPAGAIITSAHIQFTTDETSNGNADLTIRAFATDHAPTFQTVAYSISTRAVTNASQTWAPAQWNVVHETGPDQRTPDLAAVVQEVVDRAGWASGQALGFAITGTGTRIAESYNGAPALAPLLHVEYRLPSSPG